MIYEGRSMTITAGPGPFWPAFRVHVGQPYRHQSGAAMSVDTRALVILNRVLVHLVLAGRFAEAVDVIDLMDALWGAARGRYA